MTKIAENRTFVGGQLFRPGQEIPEGIEGLKGGVARSTPVGNMTDEDLERELAARAAKRKPLDHDDNGENGGSLTKAAIIAKLLDLKVEHDGRSSRDDLAKVLAQAEADAEKAGNA